MYTRPVYYTVIIQKNSNVIIQSESSVLESHSINAENKRYVGDERKLKSEADFKITC